MNGWFCWCIYMINNLIQFPMPAFSPPEHPSHFSPGILYHHIKANPSDSDPLFDFSTWILKMSVISKTKCSIPSMVKVNYLLSILLLYLSFTSFIFSCMVWTASSDLNVPRKYNFIILKRLVCTFGLCFRWNALLELWHWSQGGSHYICGHRVRISWCVSVCISVCAFIYIV